jgi:hypothetical protein
MGTYSIKGSAAFDALLDQHLQRIAEAASPYSEAGILLGGYGRGEGTPYILPDGTEAPFNDYDLIVIVEELTETLRSTLKQLEKKLTDELQLPVDLYPYRKADLKTCEFSLLNYEMKYGHMVIWGNRDALSAMPEYAHDAIPASEGTRLLLNRGKLLLDIQERLKTGAPLSDEETLRFIKFIFKARLALGDCALLAEKKYHISYAKKRTSIETLAYDWPDKSRLVEEYQAAIDLKEWGDFSIWMQVDLAPLFESTRQLFRHFFMAYETKRLNVTPFSTAADYYKTVQKEAPEGSRCKNAVHNLRSLQQLSFTHPRLRLYAALFELLQPEPDPLFLKKRLGAHPLRAFYRLQRRFS